MPPCRPVSSLHLLFLDTDFNSTVVEGVVPANMEMTFGIEIFDNQKVEREENFVIILNSTSLGHRRCAQGLIPATARNDLPCEKICFLQLSHY